MLSTRFVGKIWPENKGASLPRPTNADAIILLPIFIISSINVLAAERVPSIAYMEMEQLVYFQ